MTDKYQKKKGGVVGFLKWEEQIILKFQNRIFSWFPNKKWQQVKPGPIIEILVLGLWAFWVGREYLNFDPNIIPGGREFSSAIQTHHIWTTFKDCGWCAVWNGSVSGGYPAFTDIYGSMLHPLVVLSTFLLGVVNGAKIILVISLWFAGIAQWWIAKELKVHWAARIWSSGLAIVGGHLAGRMEQGNFGLVLSTAMASLVFGGILAVVNGKGKQASVLLGIVIASTLLAGQGYLQVGMLSIFPAILILILDPKLRFTNIWKYFLISIILAVVLSAVFLIPFAHYYPNFSKYMDSEFVVAQPLKYIPLNYVIDSFDYYKSDVLNKYPFPALYTLFIGWIPVLFAVYGLAKGEKISKSIKWFFITSIAIILLFSSGDALKLITKIWEGAAGIRHPSIIAGLTIPLILSLSAVGLDKLLDVDWPKLELRFSEENKPMWISIQTIWIIAIPILFSLYQGYQFTKMWIYTYEENPVIAQVIEELKTDTLQWVQTPYGDHLYIEPAVGMGLKISPGIIPWQWKNRNIPVSYLEASHSGQPEGTTGIVKKVSDVNIYIRPDQEYAAVITDTQVTPCQAEGKGGYLTVRCDSEHSGRLVIKENIVTGWKGWVDEKEVTIFGDQWISVEAPSGFHIYSFRYLPWDVPLGLAISGIGIILCIFIWYSSFPALDKFFNNKKSDLSEPKENKNSTEKDD
ncbi:MAG: hypothetical protein MUP11_04555 [Anaerolineales bacterium]|nr:hypothetical protein [Anaerolineales bacterium]